MHNITLYVQILFCVACITHISGKQCDKDGILIYEDFGCTPEYVSGNDCPVKYKCKGLEATKGHCSFRGKSYNRGEAVDNDVSSSSCDVGCICTPSDDVSKFTCAVLDCPEWLGARLDYGCYRKYSVDECCSTGQVCSPFDLIEKCAVEGKVYREGEKFSPANTCLECVCQKGFKGKFEEPFCKRTRCGQQLRSDGEKIQASCAAFYSKVWHKEVLCCPDDWICPDGTENFKGDVKSEESCKLGKKSVPVGHYFDKHNITDGYGRSFKKVRCECVIPPLMKCIEV